MVQQLNGLVRQSGHQSGSSKGSRSGVSGERARVDTRQSRVAIRPAASPVDIYEGRPSAITAEQTEAGQIAAALLQLAPSVGRLAQLSARPSKDAKVAGQVNAELVPMDDIAIAHENKATHVAGRDDPETFYSVTGRRNGQLFMRRIQEEYNPEEHGPDRIAYIEKRTQEHMSLIRQTYGDGPEGNYFLGGFLKAVNPDRHRIATEETELAIHENRVVLADADQGSIVDLLDGAGKDLVAGKIQPNTVTGLFQNWLKEAGNRARLAKTDTASYVSSALKTAMLHFVDQGNTQMVDLLGEVDVGNGVQLKDHPSYGPIYHRAKNGASDTKKVNDLENSFGTFQEVMTSITSTGPDRTTYADVKRKYDERVKNPDAPGPKFSLSQWQQFFNTARRMDVKAAEEAAEQGAILELHYDMRQAAGNGELWRVESEAKADPIKSKYVQRSKDQFIAALNRLPEHIKDDAKLRLYVANPESFSKDSEWATTIQRTLNLLTQGELNEANREAIDRGVTLYEKIAKQSSGLASELVGDGDKGRILESYVALKNAGMPQEQVETHLLHMQDAFRQGTLVFNRPSPRDIDEAIDGLDLDDGWINDTDVDDLGNYAEIRTKLAHLSSSIMAGGQFTLKEAVGASWKMVRDTHELVNGVLIPVNAKNIPSDIAKIHNRMIATMVHNPGAFNGVNIQKIMKQRGVDDAEDIVWKPVSSKNTNVWQLYMRENGYPSSPLTPVRGVTMSTSEMIEQYRLLETQRQQNAIDDELRLNERRRTLLKEESEAMMGGAQDDGASIFQDILTDFGRKPLPADR